MAIVDHLSGIGGATHDRRRDTLLLTDSPYRVGEPLFSPWVGIINGLVGGGLMLGCVAAFEPVSGVSAASAIARVGHALGASDAVIAGLVAHVSVSVLLGVLHAACLGDGPVRGLVGVGVFYGVVTWIVGGFLGRLTLGDELRPLVRSLPWFCGHLAYAVPLTGASLIAHARRAGRDDATPAH